MSTPPSLVMQAPVPHHNYVDEYLASGRPYTIRITVPANTDPTPMRKIELPYVSKFVVIHNSVHGGTNKHAHIGFYDGALDTGLVPGTPADYYELHSGEWSPVLDIKCKDIWIRSATADPVELCIIVGCTNIPRHKFPNEILEPTTGGVGVLAHNNRINVLTV